MAKRTLAGAVALPARYRNFRWKEKTNFPVPAGVAAQRIDQIKARHRGRIDPEHIVRDAQPVGSVFHDCFEWNDAIAAKAQRRSRAAEILRGLCIVRVTPTCREPVRYLWNITQQPRRGHRAAVTTYVDIHTAASNHAYQNEVLEDAIADLRAFADKYSAFSSVSGISLLLAGVNALIAQARRLPRITKKRNR